MISRKDLICAAREEVGTKFVHQGRKSKQGIDCIGLLVISVQKCGGKIKDVCNYRRNPDGKTLLENLRDQLIEINIDDAIDGDILVFWEREKTKRPQHIAIKSDKGIIHAIARKDVKEGPLTEERKKRIVAAFSIPGIS